MSETVAVLYRVHSTHKELIAIFKNMSDVRKTLDGMPQAMRYMYFVAEYEEILDEPYIFPLDELDHAHGGKHRSLGEDE